MTVHRLRLELTDARVPAVTAALHAPDEALGVPVLLTPGGGGDLDGDGLVALAEVLAGLGHPVMRVNLPHHERGAPAPSADRSVDVFREIAAVAHTRIDFDGPWVLGGKSYGGRVASLAVSQGEPAGGLLFYGYPLHRPGKPEHLRVEHWPRVGVPCCFVQGSRDTFGDVALLEEQLRKLPRRSTLIRVPGGDHSLRVTGAASPSGDAQSPRASIFSLRDDLWRWLTQLRG